MPFLMYEGAVADAWKHPLGNVYLMVNPSVLPPREGAKADDVCFKLDKSAQLQMVGVSEHYGVCEGVIKGGAKGGCKCEKWVNREEGNYCKYHAGAALRQLNRPAAAPKAAPAGGGKRPAVHGPVGVVQPPPDLHVGSFSAARSRTRCDRTGRGLERRRRIKRSRRRRRCSRARDTRLLRPTQTRSTR